VSGKGLSPEAAGRSWEDLRAWSYDRDSNPPVNSP